MSNGRTRPAAESELGVLSLVLWTWVVFYVLAILDDWENVYTVKKAFYRYLLIYDI